MSNNYPIPYAILHRNPHDYINIIVINHKLDEIEASLRNLTKSNKIYGNLKAQQRVEYQRNKKLSNNLIQKFELDFLNLQEDIDKDSTKNKENVLPFTNFHLLSDEHKQAIIFPWLFTSFIHNYNDENILAQLKHYNCYEYAVQYYNEVINQS